jgi:hypothetical protein
MRLIFSLSLVFLLVFTGWATAEKIVMVAAENPLNASDTAIKAHLEALGFEVEPHSTNEAQPVSTAGADGLLISESVSSGNVTDAYKNVDIPLMTSETYIFDDMRFAPDGTFEHTVGTGITIIDPSHPIAGGLSGNVEVATVAAEICSCSAIMLEGDFIANSQASGQTCLAAFEAGALDMDGIPIPARVVYYFAHNNLVPSLTPEGWKLVENSVLWAMGMLESKAVNPGGSLATTWGTLKTEL